jgi:hypothetical protein
MNYIPLYYGLAFLLSSNNNNNNYYNSVALVRERTIPTERPPLSAKLVPTFAEREVSLS